MLQIFLIPVDRKRNPLFKIIFGIVSQKLFRLRYIRIRMFDIAGAVRSEFGFDLFSKRPAQVIINIDQVFPSAVSDVERIARRP